VPHAQRLLILTGACLLMLVIFELVRKRRLREEYSWLWLLFGASILGVALVPFRWMQVIARQLGSETPTAVIYYLGFLALILICLQFSVRLSRQTEQLKNLGQKLALLEAERTRDEPAEAEPGEPGD
jgi:hypothetical protein